MPYVNSKKELTYSDFEQSFSFLKQNEKYEIAEFLSKQNIELVDDKTDNEPFVGNLFEENNETSQTPKNKTIIVKKDDISAAQNTHRTKEKSSESPSYFKETNEYLADLYRRTEDNYVVSVLIIKNQKFIYKIVNKINHRYNHRLDVEDLIQAGMIGFVEGCKRFDLSKGYSLLTYSEFWIRQRVEREIVKNGFLIKLPIHVWELVKKVTSRLSKYKDEEDIDKILKIEGITLKQYELVMNLKDKYISPKYLDDLISPNAELNLVDTIVSTDCGISKIQTPEEYMEEMDIKRCVAKALNSLNPKEKDVMILRFRIGEGVNKIRTLEEVGERFGVTRERIRQIEARSKSKLRILLKKSGATDYAQWYYEDESENFDDAYCFRKGDISYIPEISEIIKRVIETNPKSDDIRILCNEAFKCASQNSYRLKDFSREEIENKIRNYKNKEK